MILEQYKRVKKQAMCEFGIAPETIMEEMKKKRISEIINAIPPRHRKAHFTVTLIYAISCYGDITYGEYLEKIADE